MSSNVFIGIASEFDNKGFKQAEKATSALDKQAAKLGKTLLAAFSGQKILQYSKASVLAYSEDRRAAALLSNQLKNLGLAYAAVDVEKFIANLESQTGILDDELRPAFSQLVRVTGSLAESQNLMQVAFDASRGAGVEYLSAVDALSKAYVGNLKGLKKFNLGLTDGELKAMKFEEIVAKLNKQFKGAGAASVDTYAGKINRVNVALANAQETIGEGIVDAFSTLAKDDDFNAVIDGIANMALYTADTVRGIGEILDKVNRNTPEWLKNLIGGANVRLIPIIGDYLDYLNKTGSAAKVRQSMPQGVALFLAEQKADMKRLQTQKKITEEERKQLAAKRAKLALDKANKTLGIAENLFDQERVSVEAAMANTTLTENERKRLEIKQAIFSLEDAIASKDTARIEAATKTLNGLLGQFATLQAQDKILGQIKVAYDALGMNKDLINLTNLQEALRLLQQMNALMNGTKTPTASNSLAAAVNPTGSPYVYSPISKPYIEMGGNAAIDAASKIAAQAWDDHEKRIARTMNPNYQPVIIKVESKADDLVNFIYDTVTEQSASGNPPIVTRIGQNLAW